MAAKPPSRRKPGESNEATTTIDLTADPVVKTLWTGIRAHLVKQGCGQPALTTRKKRPWIPVDRGPAGPADASAPTLESSRVEDSTPQTAHTATDRPARTHQTSRRIGRAIAAADAAAAFGEEPAQARTASETTPSEPARETNDVRHRHQRRPRRGHPRGLVVLVAAGGLQYAGVLPSLAPREADSAALNSPSGRCRGAEIGKSGRAGRPRPVEQRLAALEQKTTEASSVDLAPLNQQLADLSAAVASLQASTGSADSARNDLTTRLDAIEKKLAEPTAETRLARAVAVTALKTAIDRGGPYLAELDAFKSVAPNDPAIAPSARTRKAALRPAPISSTPSPPSPMQCSMPCASAIPIRASSAACSTAPPRPCALRPVGDVAGDGPDAAVARIERALTNGDLKAAALEWDTLPEAAKTAGADLRRKLDRRIAVEAAMAAPWPHRSHQQPGLRTNHDPHSRLCPRHPALGSGFAWLADVRANSPSSGWACASKCRCWWPRRYSSPSSP